MGEKQVNSTVARLIIGIVIACVVPLVAGLVTYGTLLGRVDSNSFTIERHYEDGCKPSVGVRADLEGMKSDIKHIHESQQKLEVSQNNLESIQREILRELRTSPP